ncbi:protein SHORTAGE IN CHIASMATA 1 isoform X2 [Mercurialis annua]|uniref:protein SHORTAGE IN CHIASMATA 1 isoform X2 n=1 Tax=Mercurialis annua TaxID=3986 RepID=UPI0021603955|nr:protein SHORTAGE IN CHIASMATA 1 isoform X2 [Mercurialis annua]
MRTRFLNTDYFSSPNEETLTFLNLPIPNLLPSLHLPNLNALIFSSLDPYSNISIEIDRFPIDAALSKFISHVTPRKIDVDDLHFEDRTSRIYSVSEKEEETATAAVDTELAHGSEVILQFEEPELDALAENLLLPEEHLENLSEAPEIEIDPDFLRPGIKMQNSDKVQQYVYSVEDVTLDYDMIKQASVLDDDSGQEKMNFHHISFPLLEVDEINLRNLEDLSMEDELSSFSDNINFQWTQNDNPLSDGAELLDSMRYDVLEFLSDHCLSKIVLESEPASMDIVLAVDIIGMIDNVESAYCSLPVNPPVFQEYEFFEMDSSQACEVFFEKQKSDVPETWDWIFCKDKNFKDFNELIVSSELALVDEIFKTMPTPILSNGDKVKPLYSFIEKILDKVKPESFSLVDGIYLDWHLLEEDKCNSGTFCYWNVLKLDLHKTDFDWDCFDERKEVIDLALSDCDLDDPKIMEPEESLNMFSEVNSSVKQMGVESSKLSDDKCSKSENAKPLAKENAEKATLLFKSMSQFNDLDFFLNHGKATGGGKSESVITALGPSTTFPKESESRSILAADDNVDDHRMEKVLHFSPMKDDHSLRSLEAADRVEACGLPVADPNVPNQMKSEPSQGCLMSSPEIVIVVNTQNFDKEMIVSRRSTYQKILAMEKEGLQVVERDLDLPVDVVIISAICLVWYDCRNIRKKATAADEASSSLPICIDNIATNVLTLLSCAFSCCVLVFEGDTNFLSTVMESSDGLYAAAASLGIDLQLFCSYSSELTDEIILSNICYAAKLYQGACPKMPESETLAESFLTKFPSINPLTAHAILSSEGLLIEFLGWSNERRILAVQQHYVSEESIALFSALCSYGEREDSKSIMTDCSSSVSSGPDSNKDNFNVVSEIRQRKCMRSPQKVDMCVADMWQPEPLNQFLDDTRLPAVSGLDNCWISRESEILNEFQWPELSLNDLSGHKQGSGTAQMVDSSPISKHYDCQKSKGPLILDEIKMSRSYLNDNLSDENYWAEMTTKKKLDWSNTRTSNVLHEDVLDREEDSRKSKAPRRLSFDKNCGPTFPTAAAINSRSDLLYSEMDHLQSSQQNNEYPDCGMPLKHPKELLEDILAQGSTRNAKASPFKEEISHFGGTPLSKAIHSTYPQAGSPWTLEFLNRIREKSRQRQQSLPCDSPTPDFGFTGSIPKVVKRRSPSILEFFKYKGGSNRGKAPEQKKQKQSRQLSSASKSARAQASFVPASTPIDKRSRQTLSFALNENGSQTRLVWSDGSAHRLNKKFRHQ